MLHFLYRENRGQSAAMPACTLAFASLCLQNALMLLKSGEVTQVHESESVQENQAVKEEDSLGQETDASRYVGLVTYRLSAESAHCRVSVAQWWSIGEQNSMV